jgi:hypothetical protein
MEELQWGFPIATPLSLNKPHINEWEVKGRIRKRRGATTSGLTSAAQ